MHCEQAKRSRIGDTHRLRSSLQFWHINNQSLLYFFLLATEQVASSSPGSVGYSIQFRNLSTPLTYIWPAAPYNKFNVKINFNFS